jgi:hypothetical protein
LLVTVIGILGTTTISLAIQTTGLVALTLPIPTIWTSIPVIYGLQITITVPTGFPWGVLRTIVFIADNFNYLQFFYFLIL